MNRTEMVSLLSAKLRETLGLKEGTVVEADSELSHYGLDSLNAARLAHALSAALKCFIAPGVILQHFSLADLAGYLTEELRIESLPNEPTAPVEGTAGAAEKEQLIHEIVCQLKHTKPSGLPAGPNQKTGADSGDVQSPTGAAPRMPEYAIVGLAGRFPGARNVEGFWRNLLANQNCITELGTDRYDWRAVWGDPKVEAGRTNIRHFGLIDNMYRFDASFFGISKREAELMDPHARLLLETAWQCLENAGYLPRSLSGSRTGVFLSFYNTEYAELLSSLDVEQASEPFLSTTLSSALMANRISYLLGLQGPSETYNTACSSGLVALHRAVQAMAAGDCEQVLVAGASLLLTPARVIALSKLGVLNDGGLCGPYSFPARKEVIGEGVGALFIKPLEAAIVAKDYIYAVVAGSDVSHNGGDSGSLTMPSANAIAELLERTYRRLGLKPDQIGYIEGHGPGNDSDAVELIAFARCFASLPDSRTVSVGSVKSNIGFGEGSGGLAQLAKSALSLNHGTIPATLNFERADPSVDLAASKVAVQTTNRALEGNRTHHLSVLAYGLGGTNAHVVLRSHVPPAPTEDPARALVQYPMLFSARSEAALTAYMRDVLAHLASDGVERNYERSSGSPSELLRSLSQTLIGRESQHRHRLALLVSSYEDFLSKLTAVLSGEPNEGVVVASASSPCEPSLEVGGGVLDEQSAAELARIWVNGGAVDWLKFYEGRSYQRIALPPCPFLGEELRLRPKSGRAGSSADVDALPREGRAGSSVDVDALPREAPINPMTGAGDQTLLGRVRKMLIREVAVLAKIESEEIDLDTALSAYGLRSIGLTALANQLSVRYGIDLRPTIFFEYPTLGGLAARLTERYAQQLSTALHVPTSVGASTADATLRSTRPVERASGRSLDTAHSAAKLPSESSSSDAIAIVGVSGCFPGANNLQELWKNLLSEKNCIGEVPPSRWDWQALYGDPTAEENRTNIKWGGFVESVESFDPMFFGISPREAEFMDPVQRLLMIHVWRLIEDAGYSAKSLAGSQTAIFLGTETSGFGELVAEAGVTLNAYSATGMAPSMAPARMSYLLDLRGPSEVIDTACSSSLVAIHRGARAIQSGDCEQALVGGIQTILTPTGHLILSKTGVLSEDGRCKTFSKDANGYVRSEGVGMLFLKKLSAAKRDGDHVYGLIKGSAENHGGRANSLTAPNPSAQKEAIKAAYREAQIDPRTVTYIEAHGTGTILGDPIEIEGLKQAFAEMSAADDNPASRGVEHAYCGIASVKTSIGHLEHAAGVAGVIKVLLQFKHKLLVKSLHCEEMNPHIQLDASPFYIVRETQPWTALSDKQGEEAPRRAGVSSFGIGGVNSHVVLEEYVAPKRVASPAVVVTSEHPALIVLSARTEERLREQVKQLSAHLSTESFGDDELANIAYTLQVGREAMEQRLAFTATTLQELRQKLEAFGDPGAPKDNREHFYRGEAKRNKDIVSALNDDEDAAVLVKTWREKGKYERLLEVWAKGLVLDWRELYVGRIPQRVSLPTYPFTEERYWVHAPSRASSADFRMLHPLVQRNTSTLAEQRFSSMFTGEEFFLRDHVVKGRRVLPGVAHLEMARAAVEQATSRGNRSSSLIHLKDVVFLRPVVVGEAPLELHIGLYPCESGEIDFEIYSDGVGESLIHSQGRAVLADSGEPPALDLGALRTACSETSFSGAHCYEAFGQVGLEYGPAQQAISTLYRGRDVRGSSQVLAHLNLPTGIIGTQGHYVLHPSLTDASLQAAIGLAFGDASPDAGKPTLPFAIEEVRVFGPELAVESYALIRFSERDSSSSVVQKLDIAIADGAGRVLAEIRGYAGRVLEGEIGQPVAGTLLLTPRWRTQPIRDLSNEDRTSNLCRWVVLSDTGFIDSAQYEECIGALETQLQPARCIKLRSSETDAGARFTDYAATLFDVVQGILSDKDPSRALLQLVVVDAVGDGALLRGLTGLLRTAQLESSRLRAQFIILDPSDLSPDQIVRRLKENAGEQAALVIRYRDGVREVAVWEEASLTPQTAMPWKTGGIYLLTGGAGGLGLIFAKEIAHRVEDATLILTGRSVLSDARRGQIDAIEALGVRVEYHALDVGDRAAVDRLFAEIRQRFGKLSGIVHAAGVIQDNFIVKKPADEVTKVLAPKVAGLVNIDEASRALTLDFLVAFSSTSGVFGNAGQSDYAMGNAFMDAYVSWRNVLVNEGKRYGRTLSINWSLWADGGMQVDRAVAEQMRTVFGLVPLPSEAGLAAFYAAFSNGSEQVVVLEGPPKRLREVFGLATRDASAGDAPAGDTTGARPVSTQPSLNPVAGDLEERVRNALVLTIAQLSNIPAADLDVDTELTEFGLDSIGLTSLSNTLNRTYGLTLNPTVFFEYPTIRDFAEHLVEEHQAILAKHFDVGTTPSQAERHVSPSNSAPETGSATRRRRFTTLPAPSVAADQGPAPIAIIGVSACFPEAPDLNSFWKILESGTDCITKIPKARWDWQALTVDAGSANAGALQWGAFIEGVADFDPLFFGISPREAQLMDPQQRLLMTHAWKAIEDAGYSPHDFSGTKTGIFVGTGSTGYGHLVAQANLPIEAYSSTGTVSSVGPNRMSYWLNLHGPSEPIETACSSSLVAIHRAVRAMQCGDCDFALVGGVNTIVTPWAHISFSKAGMLSADGRCKTFSKDADGYVRGEGVGMLLLKRLSAAERDGDHIYGLIRGTSENHGGRASSLTAPNPKAQAELIKTAYQEARIDPRSVSYIEAHGTGTSLGDPIEINGLKSAFSELYRDPQLGTGEVDGAHCGLGSVKTNVGHLELAAGIAGVVKVLLQLKHKTLVKTLHCQEINPYIELKNSPFYIVRETQAWAAMKDERGRELPRRAGISSFGFGGVNAHVILEEHRVPERLEESNIRVTPEFPALIVLSAKTETQLDEQAKQLLAHVNADTYVENDLANIAYTLQVGRDAMERRLAFTATTIKEMCEKLEAFVRDGAATGSVAGLYRGGVKGSKDVFAALNSDVDTAILAKMLCEKRKLTTLLSLWTKGLVVDWTELYGGNMPQRLSLPTYPFTRQRYWVPDRAQRPLPDRAVPISRDASPSAQCIVTKHWEASSVSWKADAVRSAVILCRRETQGLAERLAARVECSRVLVLEDGGVGLSPHIEWRNYATWIDLVGCGVAQIHEVEWITKLQRWLDEGSHEGMLALCVTRALEAHENRTTNLCGADRVGLYRMLSSEYSRVCSRHIDLDADSDELTAMEQILAECGAPRGEIAVCYRSGQRYRSVLKDQRLHADVRALETESHPVFPSERVLWITGGTRGIGYLCAQHFVQRHGVKKIVLTGRESLPPREDWPRAQLEDTPVAQKIRDVLALEFQGAKVSVLSVPLTDPVALRESIQTVKETLGPIGGLLHCAGVVDAVNPALIRKSVPSLQAVFNPKTTGVDILVQCFADEPLDFLVLFSSVAAAIPRLGVGLSDYAAANAYMDYVAEAYAATVPITSIQWPSWKETGMGESRSATYRELGFLSHSNTEGLQFLDRLIARKDGAVVMPAIIDTSRWRPAELLQSSPKGNNVNHSVPSSRSVDRLQMPGSSAEAARIWLRELTARELGVRPEDLEIDTPLADYGADSIMLAQLLRLIGERVGESLDPSILLEHSTIEKFSRWLVERHGDRLVSDVGRSETAYAAEDSAKPSIGVTRADAERHGSAQEPRAPGAGENTARQNGPVPSAAMDIAVVGMSGRFADANNIDEFWQLLAEGRSAIRRVPAGRWGGRADYHAALLDDGGYFHAERFLINAADASAMDPQALLVLEQALLLWHQAGYAPEDLKGRSIGVYLGARSQHVPDATTLASALNPMMVVGQNYLAANVSRVFDLRGPSVVIDTACSSALVAMNMAIQSLRSQECESALVGGVNLLATDGALQLFERRGILNNEPKLHLFDRRAKGAVLGEGAGAVWLKTVEQALRDGDTIYAVVKAVAINNDGRTAGPAAPNIEAQKAVMLRALEQSGKRAEDISYVEVNGSGTEVTDLLELKAIESVYRPNAQDPCELGSMKPNIGHPLCAEGIASFIKAVLMLHRGQRVPFLSAREPMRHYDLGASPFHFSRELSAVGDLPSTIAINSFADGGTNAHVIVEKWTELERRDIVRRPIPAPELQKKYRRSWTGARVRTPHADRRDENMVEADSLQRVDTGVLWKRFTGEALKIDSAAQ